jgi:hypothetical protein
MRSIFASVCTDFEAELVEFDGEDDHVHLLVNYPPRSPSPRWEQPKGRVEPNDSPEEISKHPQSAVERRSMVALLLRRKLWRRTHLDSPPVHRATADAELTLGTATPYGALDPGLKAEVCRTLDQNTEGFEGIQPEHNGGNLMEKTAADQIAEMMIDAGIQRVSDLKGGTGRQTVLGKMQPYSAS